MGIGDKNISAERELLRDPDPSPPPPPPNHCPTPTHKSEALALNAASEARTFLSAWYMKNEQAAFPSSQAVDETDKEVTNLNS